MKIRWGLLAVEIAVALLILYSLSQFFAKPEYPEIFTPKPALGNPNASILIEEYSDFQCPFCKKAEEVIQPILEQYGKEIRFEYHHYPILTKHPYALKAAEASECANDQGEFWRYHDILFKNQEGDGLKVSNLKRYAEQLGLDTEKFNACLDSDAKKDIVLLEEREGVQKGVIQTPSFLINGKLFTDWTPANFKSLIEEELER